MIRRKLTVSLTVSVVSGIISDVSERSSVCRIRWNLSKKREIGYATLSVKKKEN